MTWLSTLWNIIKTITIADVADMLIVALVIYKIMTFSVRTGLARGARGIMLLIAALWLSSVLKLTVINYVLGKTMELGILALVILFQPELRRMLERVGSGKFSHFFQRTMNDGAKTEATIKQVVSACLDMSKSRTGALIIFERDVAISDPIKTGTILNADVTAELIKNIFFVKAPMHDGAMIIKKNSVAAAGCMLPLSANPNLSRDLGMRHRAGIGMSEVSDAVVVVVSEETGSISVAVEGMLKRHLSPQTFETLLRNELLPADESKKITMEKFKNSLKVKKNAEGKNK